jgi:hypothetical protein
VGALEDPLRVAHGGHVARLLRLDVRRERVRRQHLGGQPIVVAADHDQQAPQLGSRLRRVGHWRVG